MPQKVFESSPEAKSLLDAPQQTLGKKPELEELPVSSQKRAVAEWQKQMRSGKCGSILVFNRGGSGAKEDAIFKHLESFVNAVARVQREERARQHAILEKRLAKRKEERQARGKRVKRATIKGNKSQVGNTSPAGLCPVAITVAHLHG